MQFDAGTSSDMTSVEAGLKEWEKAGYSRPRIVYWNLGGYKNAPATIKHKDVALVSGFDPSILKAILGGTDFTPMAILDRAIEKYKVVKPDGVKEKKEIKEAKTLAEDWDEDVVKPKKRVEKSRKKEKRTGARSKR